VCSGDVYLTGSSRLRVTVKSAEQCLSLVNKGNKIRAVGRTNLNEHSSRSHSILTLKVESREGKGPVCSTASTTSSS
jgi:hypothetical protein